MALKRTLALCLISLHSLLAESTATLELEHFNFVFENDYFVQTDQWYSSGLDLSLLFRLDHPPSFLKTEAITYLAFAISHEIYTPKEFNNPDLQSDDRPYAGWLYGSIALHRSNPSKLDTVELQIGIVGPSAKAEKLQRFTHDHILGDPVDGWQHQLSDEPGINLSYHHHERFLLQTGEYQTLLIPRIGAVIGNVRTELDGGLLYRAGIDLPVDFGQNFMAAPGLDSAIPAYDKGEARERPLYSYYLQLQGNLRLVGKDLFLEGNTYKMSHSVDPYPLVGMLGGGIGGSYRQYEASLTYTVESKSFTQQPTLHAFGSLLFTYHY